MLEIQSAKFGPGLAELLEAAEPMPLDAGVRNAKLAAQIELLTWDTPIRDANACQACLAGLWLLANDLDRSHRISQELKTPEGSFWHGILHRRQGDYGNAKYWFRRVDRHPVFAAIAPDWDPFAFVDQVEACVVRGDGDRDRLIELQTSEWLHLFAYCWKSAFAG
jgi:hypothetical protein